ncbi:ChuX/HutX family heme-like substrate-binding protein [Neisseria dumasiana]|uniref:ChuX/HutX family heme-like substrate-binding protein n=1 Tax=Neisseria dumasiana TaxID=1931275 RepID=UPI000A198D29|nr:ChuX/HutX family heme-like substrate-binding protein [Neisseria dumasiana]OSI15379.1 hemin-degrading factor [Neisseria dumasiana]
MNLWEQYQANKARKQGMYFPREAAADLGVSEGALMADAPETVYLGGKNNVRGIVLKLHTLGLVQCIVRNSVCVHEKQGIYENVSMSETSGIAVNVGGIDLRIFPARWHHVLVVTNRDGEKMSRSVQFYDEFGVSVQKVFMREEGKEAEWQALLDAFRTEGKPEFQTGELPPATATPALPSEKEAAFQERWNELKDVHHFGGLLETFEVDRQTAYRHAPEGATKLLNHDAWQQVLEAARDRGIDIMIFAGNRGLVQIQTGKVHNVVRARGYLNVLDGKEEGFSMHLKDDEIVETWVVRRPIRDGFVTCVEGFDNRRKTVLQIFGKRKEGEPELEAWREITDKLLAS